MFCQRTRTMLRYVREAGATVLADGRGPVLAVVALGWLLVSGTRFVVPALLPQIKTTFAVSNTAAGFAVTLVWLTYAALPDDVEGVSYGLLRTVYLGIGATGSVAVGAFADADLFDEAFLFLGCLTAVVFGLYILLPSRPDT